MNGPEKAARPSSTPAKARRAKLVEPVISEAEKIPPERPLIAPQQEQSAYQHLDQQAPGRASIADVERQRWQLERDRQDMGKIGTFFGKAWTPAAQVSAILLFILTCVFVYTVGQDPEHFNDLHKALLASLSSGLAFFWGRMGK